MKRLRPPGWVTWYMLIWLSCVVLPTGKGKVRLNLLVSLISWTYGLLGAEFGLSLWARQTYFVYWSPWQLVGGACTGLLFGLVGLLLGAFCGQWCYRIERPIERAESAPAQDAYPADRRQPEILSRPPKPKRHTVTHPIWWRIVVMLTFCVALGFTMCTSLLGLAKMPRMALQTSEFASEPVRDWVHVPLADGFGVDMPGRPERQGDWMVFENADGRFGACAQPLGQDESAWRWQLWGGLLYQVGSFQGLRDCRQSGLEGIQFQSADIISRSFVGPTRVFTVCVLTRPGDPRGTAYLNSFRLASK